MTSLSRNAASLAPALPRLCLALVLLVGAVGCHESVTTGGHDSGADDSGTDGAVDGGADATRPDGGVACGATTCTGGDVCCNASCGICAAPGEGCIAIGCELTCGADRCDFGGTECCLGCRGEEFCPAEGGSCPDLACPPPPDCGGFTGDVCGAGEYCDFPDGCGFDDGSGVCTPTPTACDADCPGVCGCDGRDYCNACTAAAAGVDVTSSGSCEIGPTDCRPDDARGEGACEAIVGTVWDGSACVQISGCSCVGTDCGKYRDLADCVAQHRACAPTGASCGGFLPSDCGEGSWCDFPDEAFCGASDAPGTCELRPDGCGFIFAPVCGCDGRDYDNECLANQAGTDVAAPGRCG